MTEKNNVGLYMHFSGVWDDKVVEQHPDWGIIKASGQASTQKVSFFSPYLQTYMIPQLKELSSVYHVDGAWIDGECWAVEPDYGEASFKRFTSETGITVIPKKQSDPYYPDFMEYTRRLFREHMTTYVDAIHQFNPDFQITSNWAYSSLMPEKVSINVDFLSGDVTPQNGVFRSAFEARCLAPQGKPWDLMAWGFSWNGGEMPMSIKSAVQLKQEAAQIIAMGGGVQFYFQQNRDLSLKPWLAGMLSDIGAFCRERQPYCHKAVAVPQIALLYPSKTYQKYASAPYARPVNMLQGALYALLDAQHSVEIVMEHNLLGNTKKYPLIVVPECKEIEPILLAELKEYVETGGNLLIIGAETTGLFSAELGILSAEVMPKTQGFIEAKAAIGAIRSQMRQVSLSSGSTNLSMFYRGSDFNQPDNFPSASMRQVGKGRIGAIYFDAGTSYFENKTHLIRDLMDNMVDEMFPEEMVTIGGTHLLHVAVNTLNNKTYLNLINVAGEHTNQSAIGYDQVPPLRDVRVKIKMPKKPSVIFGQPGNKSIPFSFENNTVSLVLPSVEIHEILEIY
ncbi:MAG: hypothetical protein U5K79_13390 [Cyclobacteriaceae bacterium]|nr:hypothetical protein [Cyclobacteriaceae bacterium]